MENSKIRKRSILEKNMKKMSQLLFNGHHISINSNRQQSQQQNKDFLTQLKKEIQIQQLSQYFCNLQTYLTKDMIIIQKKYCQLPRGLYILISGKICYVWTNRLYDLSKKQQLFSQARSGIFNFTNDPCCQDIKFQQFQSFIIQQAFSIIQCQYQNCLALQDCIFIKIDQETRFNTKFDDLFHQRLKLVQNANLSINRNTSYGLFSVNIKLHSTFKKLKYNFRNKVQLSSLSIVQSGAFKPLIKHINNESSQYIKIFQSQRYAILLPGICYEVVSTAASILSIQNNPNLVYFSSILIKAHRQMKLKQVDSLQNSCLKLKGLNKNSISNSLYQKSKQEIPIIGYTKWQANQRDKKLINISKKYQKQLIISMQTCKLSLSFSEKQTQALKQQINNQKKPNILFDYNKYYIHKSAKGFKNSFIQHGAEQSSRIEPIKIRRQRKTCHENILSRYKNISKQLYHKFQMQKNQHKKQAKQFKEKIDFKFHDFPKIYQF